MSRVSVLRDQWQALRRAFLTPSALTLFFFGFGCGLPFLLVGGTLSIWLRELGFELGSIGLLSYVSMFYVFKLLWAPLLDRAALPGMAAFGRRRSWILISQLVLALALAGMGWLGPQISLTGFVALAALAAFAGATQDTAVDAYRIEIVAVEQQAALAATYTLGYRIGLMAAGAGALYIADFFDWQRAYWAMAGLMLLPIVALLLAPEPQRPAADPASMASGKRGFDALLARFVEPFVEFFQRNGVILALALLAFAGLYKLPDQMLGIIAGAFYVDLGFSKSDIATVSKVYGIWIGIAGAFLGGFSVALLGLRRSLVVATVAIGISNLLFVVMAIHPGENWAFILAISGDNLAQGYGGTVLVAFLSSLADRHFTATQYAMLVSLANLPGKLIGGIAGFLAEHWGYIGFFVFSTLSVVPALALLWWLWRRLEVEPASGPKAVPVT